MKRIVITITNNISYDQRMLKIADHFAENHEVLIVGSNTRNPPILQERNFQQKRLRSIFKKGFLFYAEFNLRLFLYLAFRKIDMVYAVDLDTLFPAYLLHKLKKQSYVFDAHEYFTELPELKGRTFVQKVWHRIENLGVPLAQYCITVNKELADIFEQKYQCSFLVVRNTPVFKEMNPISKDKLFLYQGALNTGRGLEELIDVMQFFPSYSLMLVGDGPLRKELEQRANDKKISNVQFLGMLTYEELQTLSPKALLGFNLLLGESLNYYYSLANKFFDYVMLSIPSVSMDFPVYRRLNRQFEVSVLLEELEVNELRHKIHYILNDQSKYQQLVAQCEKAKKVWHWENEKENLNKIL